MIKLLDLFGSLRILVVSVAGSLKTLGWMICLLFGWTYFFAVFVTTLVTEFKIKHGRDFVMGSAPELEFFYGSLGTTMEFLYKSISAGTNWDRISNPLEE